MNPIATLGRVNPIVIGLLGRQGSGKSTVARYLKNTYGAQIVSFATPLKNMADAFLVNLGKLHDGLYIEDAMGWEPYQRTMLDDPRWKEGGVCIRESTPGEFRRLFTLRWLMRMIGTEMSRDHLGANVWVNAAYDSMVARELASAVDGGVAAPKQVFVIDDVRFPNEVARIRDGLGIIIKLTCTDDCAPTGDVHASENVDAIPPDQIDEAVSSHRSVGSDHLIGEFNAALERLFHGPESRDDAGRVHEPPRVTWVRQTLARART